MIKLKLIKSIKFKNQFRLKQMIKNNKNRILNKYNKQLKMIKKRKAIYKINKQILKCKRKFQVSFKDY